MPDTVENETWAERVADRSPMVQRSRDRGVEQARSIVAGSVSTHRVQGAQLHDAGADQGSGDRAPDLLSLLPRQGFSAFGGH